MRTLRRAPSATLVALMILGACSSKDTKKETYLGLATPEAGKGFQLRSHGTTIPPGEDLEFCEIAELPGSPSDTYYVNAIEYGNGKDSHHLIIDAAKPGTAAEAKLASMNVGDTVPCLSSQSAFGDGFEFVGGIQTPYGEQSFPPGVGRVYHGGQRIVFDYHYYNTTSAPVEARSAVNFHLTDAANVKHIARIFGFYNWTIDTPPHQTSSFVGECRFSQDTTVHSLSRHTHKWGTTYKVWYAGGAKDGQEIFSSPHYEQNVDYEFPAPTVFKASEGFRFQCDFDNTEDHALRFGVNATDEMCILFGQNWEATDGQDLAPQDCYITQIGTDGIGRPAEGSYRPPTQAEVTACLDGSPYTGACADCACGTCGGVIADCVANPDCSAIMGCFLSTGCNSQDCAGGCMDVINAHSSALGMFITTGTCFQSCDPVCGASGDGGTADAAP